MKLTLPVAVRVGDTSEGCWCDRCLLPSACEFDYVLAAADTLTLIPGPRRRARVCRDCGHLEGVRAA